MENRLDDLFLRFQTKGFMLIEIPGLIQDVFNIIDKGKYCTRTDANQELEDLGWGLEIMDNVTYDLIKFEDNKLSLDEIEALKFAEEGSVEKKVFWELQEIASPLCITISLLNLQKTEGDF